MSFQAAAEEKESSFGAQRTTSPTKYATSAHLQLGIDFGNIPYFSCRAFIVFTEVPVTTVLA
jgi:hypothetical protein